VLHHANIGVDPSRSSRALDRADPGPGFASMPGELVQNVYGWSPGKVPVLEPAETAWTLDEGSDLVVQLHMVARRRSERVRPALGLFFSETPPSRTPVVIKLESKAIDIPAGQADYAIEDRYVLPVDVDAVSVYPHAHALAKDIKGTATLPDGTTMPLIWIEAWDIRWQDQYRYRAPVFLPRGTTVAMQISYDNSDANSRNPHTPPRRVTWGQRSTDEMGALWLEVTPRRGEDAAPLARDFFRRSLQADIARAEMLVRSDARDAAARNLLAMKYVEAGRVPEGRAHLEEALRLDPASAEAHSNLGSVLQRQGRLEEATAHLREAVRLDPGDDRVRVNLGNVLLAAGRPAEASRELQRAIALNPDNADAHFNLAMLLGPRNQLPEAVWHLGRVLEINPQNGEAHRNLAVALGLQGRIDAAIRHAQRAVSLLPESTEARDHLGRLLDAQRARRGGGDR
jgi:tetratricopeptide (TPR) repeat protein